MIEFRLPSLGADMDEGTLLEWRVVPGQAVHKGDVVAVVDTSKAAIDVEIWVDGTLHELLVPVGTKIPVGTVMATLRAPGEAAGAAPPAPAPARPEPKAAAATAPMQPVVPTAPTAAGPAPTVAGPARPAVSPAARRRAAEIGVALDALTGSGADGAVTLADVERAAQPGAAAPPARATDRTAAMRQVIGAAMARSKREIPHYYLAEPVPMDAALAWLRTHNEAQPVGQRLLSAVLLLKAVALALRAAPELNGVFVDGAFRPAAAVHLGVAISLRRGGLIAPALHAVDSLPLAQLMAALGDLVQRARAGSLRSSELSDATITVTNLGDQGVESVAGVIYPPQVALVGFGRITERAWVDGGQVVARPVLTASLAADHRVSDGHRGALFLARLRELLQRPHEL